MIDPEVVVPVTYRREWQDGFGARGWKLDVSIGEPSVIAATAEHGTRIPTSVLVHDILDHHLCGFGIGGHRNEAMALIQLASRTGADPRIDYAQIVGEDLMRGHCNGEPLRCFLPTDLDSRVPEGLDDGRAVIRFLRDELGDAPLRERLVRRFVEIGESVQQEVESRWRSMRLDYRRRGPMGLALQRILTQIDALALAEQWERAQGAFSVGNERCAVTVYSPRQAVFASDVM